MADLVKLARRTFLSSLTNLDSRQIVQVLSFVLYMYLLFSALQRRAAFPLADLFFRLDPLVALTSMVANRERLVPRLGHCDYGCNAFGQICPSAAIPSLPLDIKQLVMMGVAVVNRDRCWPWAYGIPCIGCEEMCPVPNKAIVLAQDDETGLQKPVVASALCIGCGTCEQQCPVGGDAAIRVRRE